MFLCYLIDPADHSIQKVDEGFARAAELTGSEAPDVETLWSDISDPDSSLDLIHDPDAEDLPTFRLRLRNGEKWLEREVSGRAVLVACGAVPDEIAQQLATGHEVASAVEFTGSGHTGIADWLKSDMPEMRAPARRQTGPETAHPPHRRTSGSGRR